MNISKLKKDFEEYCRCSDLMFFILKRDYFNTLIYSGLFMVLEGKIKILFFVQFITNIVVTLFHMYALFSTMMITRQYNFTLATFEFQLFLLAQYCLLILAILTMKRNHIKLLHETMIAEMFDYEGEDHQEAHGKLVKDITTKRKLLLGMLVVLCFVGINCLVLSPILDNNYGAFGFNISETDIFTDVPINMAYNFKVPKSSRVYFAYLLALLQASTAYFIVSVIGSASLLLLNLCLYYMAHVKCLIKTLRDIEARAEAMYRKRVGGAPGTLKNKFSDGYYLYCYEYCMKKNIRHHQLILGWFKTIQSVIGTPLGFSYATGSIVIALSLLSIKTGNSLPGTAMTSFLTCLLEIFFMGLVSVLGQQMTDYNEELRSTAYSIKWYMCSPSIKRNVAILQEMTLRTVELKGFGIVSVNLDTFSNVMNTAYSYYNLIMAF